MFSQISAEVARERELELRRNARRGRRVAASADVSRSAAEVTIRAATAADQRSLERLAQLDSGSVPRGYVLVAELGGELRAALPVSGGPAIADPFAPTAPLTELLEVRAAQLRAGEVQPAQAPAKGRFLTVAER